MFSTKYPMPEYAPIGESMYSLLLKNCNEHLSKPALSYFGQEWTFEFLLKRIDLVAAALTGLGIGKGDVVMVSLPSIPEAVELFYAVNKIGAIYCGADCRSTASEIQEILAQVNPKACFVSDFHLHTFKDVDDIPVFCVSFMKTISAVTAFASFFVEIFTRRVFLVRKKANFSYYHKFIKDSMHPSSPSAIVDAYDICAYFYTSGTTYGKKCVMLTNENINSSVLQYAYSQPGIADTNRFCTIMPLFTCYGISLGTHLPLILGKQVRMIPLFSGADMKKLLLREKPGYITSVPAHWEHFIKDDFTGVDLSFFKGAIVGGDKLTAQSEDKMLEIFKKCGSSGKVMRGYGLTEASTAVTSQPPQTPKGSVGTNMCWSTIGVFEPGTQTPLPRGTKGEICITGPNVCQGYLNDTDATAKLLKRHSDGKIWLHSGDIGYLDNDNFLYFCERIKRIFVRFDGTKISPFAIEQQLYNCPVISHCLVYGADDPEHLHGKIPHALIVYKEEYDPIEAERILNSFIQTELAYHLHPAKITPVDSLPITKNGKFDYFCFDAVSN